LVEAFAGDGDGGAEFLGEGLDAELLEHPAVLLQGGVGAVGGVAVAAGPEEGLLARLDVDHASLVFGEALAGAGEFAEAGGDGGEVAGVLGEPGPGDAGDEAGLEEAVELLFDVQHGGGVGGGFGGLDGQEGALDGLEDAGDGLADGVGGDIKVGAALVEPGGEVGLEADDGVIREEGEFGDALDEGSLEFLAVAEGGVEHAELLEVGDVLDGAFEVLAGADDKQAAEALAVIRGGGLRSGEDAEADAALL